MWAGVLYIAIALSTNTQKVWAGVLYITIALLSLHHMIMVTTRFVLFDIMFIFCSKDTKIYIYLIKYAYVD